MILSVYVPLFLCMLGLDVLGLGVSLSGWARAGLAALAGAVLQAFSFCTLHDASHYGLLFKVMAWHGIGRQIPGLILFFFSLVTPILWKALLCLLLMVMMIQRDAFCI